MTDTTTTPSKTWYDANCHCRAVQARLKIPQLYPTNENGGEGKHSVTNCNCSICSKNGYLLVYPDPEGEVEWVSGKDGLKGYQFGNKNGTHYFCGDCGSSVTIEMMFGGQVKVAFNVRMIKGIDVDKLELKKFDGWNMIQPPYEA